MNNKKTLDLYELLPAHHRIRDAERGYPLRALLHIIGEQADIVKQNIDGLFDDFFIETCAEWVIPYIGDLVGNNPLHEVAKRRRADVAKTIYYRRRKSTLPMLEELARDVTGWKTHAVAFFELLDWTQNMNHIRLHSNGCPDVRGLNKMDLVDTAFDSASHTVDVRAIEQTEGWYNIKNIGFFLWRLQSYPLVNVQARPVTRPESDPGDYRYHFSTLGNAAPLFHHPLLETDEVGLANEIHIPHPIRPVAFYKDLKDLEEEKSSESTYYGKEDGGENKSFYIKIKRNGGEREIPVEEIICKNLKDWARPPARKVGVDVVRGRITFPVGEEPDEVTVSYHYGFSADIGGGLYERLHTLANPEIADWEITVRRNPKSSSEVGTISDALNRWAGNGRRNGIIHIADSGTYEEPIQIELAEGGWLVIEANDRQRPTLRVRRSDVDAIGDIDVTGNHPDASLVMNGLLIEGAINLQGSLGRLQIAHCTLVPGLALNSEAEDDEPLHPDTPSIQAASSNTSLEIEIDHSIVGALRLTRNMTRLTLRDSILDGLGGAAIADLGSNDRPGPPAVLERATVLGEVYVKELSLASEVIFTGRVFAERTQAGCVRFSYVPRRPGDPLDSRTPRRFRCQPDLALAQRAEESDRKLLTSEVVVILARLQPGFTSTRYGQPAYCQLRHNCPEEIKTGAEDGSEMGVFRHLSQPQRVTNLRIRLEEYLPFGLRSGFIYVT